MLGRDLTRFTRIGMGYTASRLYRSLFRHRYIRTTSDAGKSEPKSHPEVCVFLQNLGHMILPQVCKNLASESLSETRGE